MDTFTNVLRIKKHRLRTNVDSTNNSYSYRDTYEYDYYDPMYEYPLLKISYAKKTDWNGNVTYDTTITGWQLNNLTSIKDIEDVKTLRVYPNPVKEKLNIITNNSEKIKKIYVFDLSGKTVMVQTSREEGRQIDVKNLEKGIYIIQAVDNRNSVVFREKVIKE